MTRSNWYNIEVEETLLLVHSSVTGLTTEEVQSQLSEHGANVIPVKRRRSLLLILVKQFANVMTLVLLAAALISGFIGEIADTIAILVIVLINAVIGTVQEFKAERAVEALRKMAAPHALVMRDGKMVSVAAAELVPGDLVTLEAGNIVPADLRLLEAEELQADESALTGESHPVQKHSEVITETDLPIGDRQNLAFKSSLVTRGRGVGVVVATGLESEIGRIAELLSGEADVKTPLQVRVARFSRYLAIAIGLICALVFVAGLMQGQPILLMFLTAVSLAVAAIPEALPAVIAISLALGARKLVLHNALARNLPAVETLGSVTYICVDKTGTLTQNRMTAELFFAAGEQKVSLPGPQSTAPWVQLGQAVALNNDVVNSDGEPTGEPTELALFKTALEAGFDKTILEQELPRLAVIPFDSTRQQMTTLHQCPTSVVAYVKGAPERVLSQCTTAIGADGACAFELSALLATAEQLAHKGYRVLAVAQREFKALPESLAPETIEQNLTFLGLVALIDPPRPEVSDSIADCLTAGITPVMITGDHPGTAIAIARRLGITVDEHPALGGEELANLSDRAFSEIVETVRVYARVSPEQKLRIVKALQEKGAFVAMTGDGVNDAPAIKRAGIGVSMGQKGTDVAREASDIVLLDDNFSTIVRAVRVGRRIFDNIRKFIKYTMSSNMGEILTLCLAPFLGLPIPLLPIHILWINLVTDGLPGLALTAEPAEPEIMRRPPRSPDENIFAHGMWQHIIWVGFLIGGLSLSAMAWALTRGAPYWQTVVFTVLTFSQLFHALAVRSESESIFRIGLLSNLPMLGALSVTFILQLAVIYVPALNGIFHTNPLPLFDFLVCLGLSSLVFVAVEIEKSLVRAGILYQNR